MTFALDSSALLRYIDGEAEADRIAEIFLARLSGTAGIILSTAQWGEAVGVLYRRHGLDATHEAFARLNSLAIQVIPVTAERAARAAAIKIKYQIPYADAFCVELAFDSPDCILITADFDLKPAAKDISIEFLPTKSKP